MVKFDLQAHLNIEIMLNGSNQQFEFKITKMTYKHIIKVCHHKIVCNWIPSLNTCKNIGRI